MAEGFENKDNIIHDWAKIRYKMSRRGINQVREAGRSKIKPFVLENDCRQKKYSAVEYTKHKIGSGFNPINKMLITLIY